MTMQDLGHDLGESTMFDGSAGRSSEDPAEPRLCLGPSAEEIIHDMAVTTLGFSLVVGGIVLLVAAFTS